MQLNLRALASDYCPPVLRPFWDRIDNSPTGYRLAKGMFWSMAGAVVSRALGLVASIFVARILGKEGYGEWGIVHSTVGMLGTFAGFGLGLTTTKHVAEFRASDPARAGRIIGLSSLVATGTGGAMALGLFVFAPWLARHTLAAPHLAGVLRIGALILYLSALNGAQTGSLSGFEAFKTIASVSFLTGLFSFPVLMVGVWWGGLTGAVWASTATLGFNWFLNFLALRRETRRFAVPLTFRGCAKELPVVWKFSLPAVLGGAMVGPVTWACNAMLVNQPGGYGEMGVYNAASQWSTALMFLPGLLGGVVLPILSEQMGRGDTRQSSRTLVAAVKANAVLVIPFAVLLSALSPLVMGLYGSGFENGWPTLVVVLFSTALVSVQTPVGQIIAASGRMWTGLVMNAGWALVFALGTLLLVHHGSLGLAGAKALSYVIHATWTLGFAVWVIRRGATK